MSDEDWESAQANSPRMGEIIRALWSSVRQLVDKLNKEAAEVDAMKKALEAYADPE